MQSIVKDDGDIFTLTDFLKFYDKEMLSDVVLSAYEDTDKKALRLWW